MKLSVPNPPPWLAQARPPAPWMSRGQWTHARLRLHCCARSLPCCRPLANLPVPFISWTAPEASLLPGDEEAGITRRSWGLTPSSSWPDRDGGNFIHNIQKQGPGWIQNDYVGTGHRQEAHLPRDSRDSKHQLLRGARQQHGPKVPSRCPWRTAVPPQHPAEPQGGALQEKHPPSALPSTSKLA